VESQLLVILGSCHGDFDPAGGQGATTVRQASVRRAIEHVEQSAGPITAWELAMAVGVSQRTLEYGFREVLGITPCGYLRVHRLNQAHRDLSAADPSSTTVARIALNWGFGHLGRFAIKYRQLFGRTPSTTLARARRSPTRLVDVLRTDSAT